MSVEAENVGILRRAYEAWDAEKASDIDCWISIVDEEARLTSLADGAAPLAFSRKRSGRSEIVEYLQDLIDTWEMIFYRIDEYVAQGDRVVAIGSTAWRNKLTRKIATTPKIDVWRMRNGKIVEFSEFYDTARLYAASEP
jgi:ketosteroid isomerase-like protein